MYRAIELSHVGKKIKTESQGLSRLDLNMPIIIAIIIEFFGLSVIADNP